MIADITRYGEFSSTRSWKTRDSFREIKRNEAGEGIRTLDIQLGKLSLCQLSYTRQCEIVDRTSVKACWKVAMENGDWSRKK